MIRISFVMPTFNRAHLVRESLAAVHAAMGPADELIVINDGSTDDTAAVIAASGVPHRYLEQCNAGKAAALNRALEDVRGEYVWVCDDDDLLLPDAVEPLAAALAAGEEAAWAFGRYRRFADTDDGPVDLNHGYWPDLSEGSLIRHILEDLFVMPNAMLVRTQAYRALGGYSPTMARSEDYEFLIRLALSFQGRFVDHVVYAQREHGGARGMAGDLKPASQSVETWRDYDHRIFDALRQALPLSFYESLFQADDPVLRSRAALLQRACVEARHDRWAMALDDIEAACRIGAGALDGTETMICRRMFEAKHGRGQGFNENIVDRLRRLRNSEAGRSIVEQMLLGTAWRLRSHDGQDRRAVWRLLVALLGLTGSVALLTRITVAKRVRGHRVSEIDPALLDAKWFHRSV